MKNPFKENKRPGTPDHKLVQAVIGGDHQALEALILRHQAWIYNIALRMVYSPAEAEDVTQEVMLKMITRLNSFQGKSQFRTWLYQIAKNHILDRKKSRYEEKLCSSFSDYGAAIDSSPDQDFPDLSDRRVDESVILEEIKIECMTAMLHCLDREERLCFILGFIFGFGNQQASEIMEISNVNYRQKLSRARKKIRSFMNRKCGLVSENNSCHCRKKAAGLIQKGIINPDKLEFQGKAKATVKDMVGRKLKDYYSFYDKKCRDLFRNHPFRIPPDYYGKIREIVSDSEFRQIFNTSSF